MLAEDRDRLLARVVHAGADDLVAVVAEEVLGLDRECGELCAEDLALPGPLPFVLLIEVVGDDDRQAPALRPRLAHGQDLLGAALLLRVEVHHAQDDLVGKGGHVIDRDRALRGRGVGLRGGRRLGRDLARGHGLGRGGRSRLPLDQEVDRDRERQGAREEENGLEYSFHRKIARS